MQAQDASSLDITPKNLDENPKASIKSISWAPKSSNPTFITSDLASQLRLYNLNPEDSTLAQKAEINTESPCLSVSWCGDEDKVASGGLDCSVKLFDLTTWKSTTIGSHEDSVKSVYWLGSTNQILSLSLDKTVRFWDPRQEGPTASYTLDHQVYCSNLMYPYLGIALSEQKMMLLNIEEIEKSIGTEKGQKENLFRSTLGDMTEITCLRLFSENDSLGFGLGGIDGRCNITKVREGQAKLSNTENIITFKTLIKEKDGSEPAVFPVNCIGFHPKYGKDFLWTGRGDGKMDFWDVKQKMRIANFEFGGKAVTQAEIDPNGKFLAYSLRGNFDEEGVETGAKICVHILQEREMRSKAVAGVEYPINYP